jgi:hypothetical protein
MCHPPKGLPPAGIESVLTPYSQVLTTPALKERGTTFENTLYGFHPQDRETAAIWRLVRELMLHWGLSDGRIFRWWAINIPLDLLPDSGFRGDIDLMACTRGTPFERRGYYFKTWEIKLMLVDKTGKPHSLKSNKTRDIVRQLTIQRKFGSPSVSLLELYLHESGSPALPRFPLRDVARVVVNRASALANENFGYQVLPFGHHIGPHGEDYGLYTTNSSSPFHPHGPSIPIVYGRRTKVVGEFRRLATYLAWFAENESLRLSKPMGFVVVTLCRECRKLCLISKKDFVACYRCGAPFAGSPLPTLRHPRFNERLYRAS